MKKYLVIVSLLILISCDQGTNKLKTRIYGTWELESVLTPGKQLAPIKGINEYSFEKDGTYKYTSIHYDVIRKFKGNYTIVDTSETKSQGLLIIFQPIILTQFEDTIRQFETYEILKLTQEKLTLRHQSRTWNDTLPLRWYNRLDNYKRKK